MRAIVCGILLSTLVMVVRGLDLQPGQSEKGLTVPFELIDNHIKLEVRVNGSRPLTFMLDTGASHTIIGLTIAQSLGISIRPIGKVESGIGADLPDAFVATDDVVLSLTGVEFPSHQLVAMPMENTEQCVHHVDGILGKDFFDRFVVVVDYPAKRIDLYDPQRYVYHGRGTSLPIEVNPDLTFVKATIKAAGRRPAVALLAVDTGAGIALSLTKPFTEAHGLLPPPNKLTPSSECGVGGLAREGNLLGQLDELRLGGLLVSNPSTVFYQAARVQRFDGLLGGEALRHFRVIFDYARRRMILE
jgi:hypothetical protein